MPKIMVLTYYYRVLVKKKFKNQRKSWQTVNRPFLPLVKFQAQCQNPIPVHAFHSSNLYLQQQLIAFLVIFVPHLPLFAEYK